jgi:hypothetical protein
MARLLAGAPILAMHAKSPAFKRAPAEASRLISEGEAPVSRDFAAPELAAMTTVARAILNMHETITRN